jgi:glycosyltransferase involved in cell wall biosynthesis
MTEPPPLCVVLLGPASSVHTRRWASTLARSGHRVIVASWEPGPSLPGVELEVAPAVGSLPVHRYLLAVPWLRRLVRSAAVDVVHTHSLGAHGLLSLAVPSGPARVVSPWGSELSTARQSAGRALVIRLALHRADLVLPTSGQVAAEVTGRYGVPRDRTRILSWGVAEDLIAAQESISPAAVRSEFGIPAHAAVVLSIRNSSATYRIREVVAAFAAAAAIRRDLFLVVLAGHRPDREAAGQARDSYLEALRIAAGPTADQVLVIDHELTPEHTFGLMCASDIAVSVPRTDQRSSSVLEAALAGCHLMLSDIPPYRELVGDGLAAELVAEPISRTLTAPLLRAVASEAGRRINRDFILAQEHGADKSSALQSLYRQLGTFGPAGSSLS